MSRAFIKEDAGDDELPERAQSASPNYVTLRGLDLLRRRVTELKAKLGALGPDDRARREVSRDLKYYERRIARAIPVDCAGRSNEEARFGATVLLRGEDGRELRYEIVGQDEAEEGGAKISWDSSPALALMGAKAGQTVELSIGDQTVRALVAEIAYPPRPS